MSVKFQETMTTKVTGPATDAAQKLAEKAGMDKDESIKHKIGEYLTGGETGKGYLAV